MSRLSPPRAVVGVFDRGRLVDLAEEFGDNGPASQLAAEEYPAKSGKYLVVAAGNDPYTPKERISPEGLYTLDGADALSASEDSAGGLYAAWVDGRGVMLAHSSDGGI
jgi:hypothetical protein